ncbi:MAG: transposase [Ignavibacterium sp.]|nr:transposase [Ignavibacterium sp.]
MFADKGYANKSRRKKLEKNNIFDGILAKGYRNKTLSKAEIRFNRLLSTVRNKVERPFAYMKRILNYQRCSYYDLNRNRFEFIMNAFVYNIRKLITATT